MAVFSSSDELMSILTKLWDKIKAHPDMSNQITETKLIVQFKYRDPDGLLTIDCSDGKDLKVMTGPTNLKPVIEMSMKADVAHEFWMGRVNVPVAVMTGKIASKGPTPKALALLPAIKPAYKMYPEVLKEEGKEHLLAK
jgi:putative sterol carrier protein